MNILKHIQKNKNKGLLKVKSLGANLLIGLALFLIPTTSFAATVDQLNQQINATQQKLNQTTSQKNTLAGQVAAYDTQISSLQSEINATAGDIANINTQISQTNAKITQAEADLAKARSELGDVISASYEYNQQSKLEVIAKANTFSDFVNQATYLESVQIKITDTANKIVALKDSLAKSKAQLEADKAQTQSLLSAQALQQQAIATQRSAQNSLLVQAKNDAAGYQSTLNNLYAQRAALSARNNESISGGGSSYPYSGSNPNGVDPWGYYFRQCTSYAAWHSATSGPISGSMLSSWGHGGRANGGDWGNLARRDGLSVSYTPHSGDVMSFPYSSLLYYGHVAIVESVNGDGTVNISEYNWSIPLGFDRRSNVNPWNYGAVFIH